MIASEDIDTNALIDGVLRGSISPSTSLEDLLEPDLDLGGDDVDKLLSTLETSIGTQANEDTFPPSLDTKDVERAVMGEDANPNSMFNMSTNSIDPIALEDIGNDSFNLSFGHDEILQFQHNSAKLDDFMSRSLSNLQQLMGDNQQQEQHQHHHYHNASLMTVDEGPSQAETTYEQVHATSGKRRRAQRRGSLPTMHINYSEEPSSSALMSSSQNDFGIDDFHRVVTPIDSDAQETPNTNDQPPQDSNTLPVQPEKRRRAMRRGSLPIMHLNYPSSEDSMQVSMRSFVSPHGETDQSAQTPNFGTPQNRGTFRNLSSVDSLSRAKQAIEMAKIEASKSQNQPDKGYNEGVTAPNMTMDRVGHPSQFSASAMGLPIRPLIPNSVMAQHLANSQKSPKRKKRVSDSIDDSIENSGLVIPEPDPIEPNKPLMIKPDNSGGMRGLGHYRTHRSTGSFGLASTPSVSGDSGDANATFDITELSRRKMMRVEDTIAEGLNESMADIGEGSDAFSPSLQPQQLANPYLSPRLDSAGRMPSRGGLGGLSARRSTGSFMSSSKSTTPTGGANATFDFGSASETISPKRKRILDDSNVSVSQYQVMPPVADVSPLMAPQQFADDNKPGNFSLNKLGSNRRSTGSFHMAGRADGNQFGGGANASFNIGSGSPSFNRGNKLGVAQKSRLTSSVLGNMQFQGGTSAPRFNDVPLAAGEQQQPTNVQQGQSDGYPGFNSQGTKQGLNGTTGGNTTFKFGSGVALEEKQDGAGLGMAMVTKRQRPKNRMGLTPRARSPRRLQRSGSKLGLGRLRGDKSRSTGSFNIKPKRTMPSLGGANATFNLENARFGLDAGPTIRDTANAEEAEDEKLPEDTKETGDVTVDPNSQQLIMHRLHETMKKSAETQLALQQWDKKNGLPKSHSQTMVNSSRSRTQLQEGVILPKWDGTPLISKETELGKPKPRKLKAKEGGKMARRMSEPAASSSIW